MVPHAHFFVTILPNRPQFDHLRSYLLDLYNSPLILENIISTYLDTLPAAERLEAANDLKNYEDFSK